MKRKIILSIVTLFCISAVYFLGNPTPLFAEEPGGETCHSWDKCPRTDDGEGHYVYWMEGWTDPFEGEWKCCVKEVSEQWWGDKKTGTTT
jgi:hypothetical protein